MNKLATLILIISTFTFLYATEAIAQRGMGWRSDRGRGSGGPCCRMFDRKTDETISGEVVSVDE